MAAYATQQELTDFIGPTALVPADADRLLKRASELMQRLTLNHSVDALKANPKDPDQQGMVDTLRDATCAQVEFWLATGEAHAILAPVGAMHIGGASYQAPDQVAPRARTILFNGGLLYRGVRQL